MLSMFLFALLTFLGCGVGAVILTIYCILAGEPIALDTSASLLYCAGICIVAAMVYGFRQSRKDAKSSLYRELQSYIDCMVPRIPEIADLRVKLHYTNETIFQGHALPKRHVYISRPWITSSSISKEALEYTKSTICHELYHISCRHRCPFSLMPLLAIVIGIVYKPFRDKYYIKMWLEELNADHMSRIWHGSKEIAIAKMESMKKLHSGKERLTDHPAWAIRIKYIQEDIVPSLENVTTEYMAFRKHLKEQFK